MKARVRAAAELLAALVALVATVLSWLHTRSTIAVAPVTDGAPPTMSVVYDPQQFTLTMMLATVAGILIVVGLTRLRRARR